jgi:hypothetical protein
MSHIRYMKSPAVIAACRRAFNAAVKIYHSIPAEPRAAKLAAYEKVTAACRALSAAKK